jgi:hypothetical protein
MKIIITVFVMVVVIFDQSAFAWHSFSAHHRAHLKQGTY